MLAICESYRHKGKGSGALGVGATGKPPDLSAEIIFRSSRESEENLITRGTSCHDTVHDS
jgi:hypothetical protein